MGNNVGPLQFRVRIAGSWCLTDRQRPHQTHQSANPVTVNAQNIAPQLTNHLARTVVVSS
jgi:hypothetical protein